MNEGQYIAEYYQTIFGMKIAEPETKLFNEIMEYLLQYRDYQVFESLVETKEEQRVCNLEFAKLRLEEIEDFINDGGEFSEFQPDCDFDMCGEAYYRVGSSHTARQG
tara:strand:+ start:82 stop:402 length:321 start_codon:yes stop_codon:yes gene_type:complete